MPLIIGYVIDNIVGDPPGLPHPIRAIGNLIALGEKIIRRIFPKGKVGQQIGGGFLTIFVVVVSFSIPFFLLLLLYEQSYLLGIVTEGFMCYQILAIKSLKSESMKVHKGLVAGDREEAQKALSMIVGRDTEDLTEEGMAKAAVETVAENCVDGAVAPMLFIAIGGAPLGFLYKAVNTLDSMIGYKNEKYKYFGTFAARLDDVFNFVPARIGAMLMIFSSGLCRYDYKKAMAIFKRDRKNHASPNSAQTEAVCAGALGIQLAGNAYYFGKLYEKKTIGDEDRCIEAEDIKRACKLHYVTALLAVIISVVIIFLKTPYYFFF